MKIVQTFWSGSHNTNKPLHMTGGWASSEYNWMSWALSTLLLRRHYDQLELYTDKVGKKILVDTLKLPYTKTHIVFDSSSKIHPKLFALAKIHTYSLQEEPFVHIDGDLFLWNPLPERLKSAGLIASNPEVDLFFNKNILDDMEEHFEHIPEHLRNLNHGEHIFSSNAGIFGGSNTDFIKKYCAQANQIVKQNVTSLNKVDLGLLNMLIEQISLFYLANQENIKTTYCVPEPVNHPLYKDYWRFADIPHVAMIHPVGGCKRIPYVLSHLARRLQLEFPKMYYHILQCCKNDGMQLENRLYNYLDLKTVSDGRSLRRANYFKTAIELKGINALMNDSSMFYKRTLLTIAHFHPSEKVTAKDLKSFVQKTALNSTVKEIFLLETQSQKCFKRLFEEIEQGEIYGSEISNYKNITSFNMDSNWTQQKVVLKNGVLLAQVKRPWGILNAKEPEKALAEMLEAPRKEYSVTFSPDLMTFGVQEVYHDKLDAIAISHVKTPTRIEALLQRLLGYFDEELEINNPSYRSLIFDILKRLAFENVITII